MICLESTLLELQLDSRLLEEVAEKIKQAGFGHARVEGLPAADWVLIDAGDVVIHLFRPEVRSFYNLERMWAFEGSEASMLGRN